jgi:hypothetical protein
MRDSRHQIVLQFLSSKNRVTLLRPLKSEQVYVKIILWLHAVSARAA